jgi:translation initiation factor IF-2
VVGNTWGKVRALEDENDERHRTAPPATPTVVIGLHDVPEAGDRLEVVQDERTARAIAEKRQQETRAKELAQHGPMLSLDNFSSRIREGQVKALNAVLKTDVQGSIEPIVNSIERLSTDDIKVNVIHSAAGNINESDINLALASEAIVIGFRVSPDTAARRMADMEGLEINTYDIIYEIVDDVGKALKGLLDPTYEERILGEAEIRQVFDIPRSGKIAGCYVRSGVVRRNAKVRVLRGDKEMYDGYVESLKRFTKDVREVKQNFECGVGVEGFNDFQSGDWLQFYIMQRVEAD